MRNEVCNVPIPVFGIGRVISPIELSPKLTRFKLEHRESLTLQFGTYFQFSVFFPLKNCNEQELLMEDKDSPLIKWFKFQFFQQFGARGRRKNERAFMNVYFSFLVRVSGGKLCPGS